MKFLQNSSLDPHFNMAFDEFCLEQLKADELVFYLWQNRPSVIIGLNQSAYAEVNLTYLREKGIVLARRVTGGGAVYHDLQNLNYTFVGRDVTPRPMVEALRRLGLEAELTGRNDIYVDGRKVSGYARRVWHDRQIVHGTLMYDVDIDTLTEVLAAPGSKLSAAGVSSVRSRVANLKEYLPQFKDIHAFQAALQALLAGHDGEIRLTEAQIARIEAEADAKYRTWEWIYGHSPAAAFRKTKKFACGRVEAAFSLKGGCIDGLRFSGDFLGNLPADRIADALQGCRYTREAIGAALGKAPVEDCFDAMTSDELTSFLLN